MMHKKQSKPLTAQDARRRLNRALDLEELVSVKPTSRAVKAFDFSLGERIAARRKGKTTNELLPLKTLTARFLAHNANAIPLDVLTDFTWQQISPVWEIIKEEVLDSLEIFAKFATAFPQDLVFRKVLHVAVGDVSSALAKIASVSMRMKDALQRPLAWSLHVDFSHITLPQETLLQIGSIPGLTNLKINDSCVTGYLLKHWSRAQSVGGFCNLKLLDIRHNPIANLAESISWLARFPQLLYLRCDAIDGQVLESIVVNAGETSQFWKDRQEELAPVLELKIHLGSRADNRPLKAPVEDVILDMARMREDLAKANIFTDDTKAGQQSILLARKKQKLKKHGDRETFWDNIL